MRPRDAGANKRGLEGEAAAQQEGYEVVPPELAQVLDLGRHLAVLVHAIQRDVVAEVRSRRELLGLDFARLHDL